MDLTADTKPVVRSSHGYCFLIKMEMIYPQDHGLPMPLTGHLPHHKHLRSWLYRYPICIIALFYHNVTCFRAGPRRSRRHLPRLWHHDCKTILQPKQDQDLLKERSMKKGLQITVFTIVFTFLLMGTAMAHPLGENMTQWQSLASILNGDSEYDLDTQSQVSMGESSQNQDLNLWSYAARFTSIKQVVEFAGYRANLSVTVQSMLTSGRQSCFVPTIAFEFVF